MTRHIITPPCFIVLSPVFISVGLPSRAWATIDVLVNQAAYEAASPKVFRAQRNADYAGNGTFSVKRVSDNAIVFSGTLTRKGALWDKWYWEGDFGTFATPGNYYVNSVVNGESANSYNFIISSGELMNQTAALCYRYFYTQRCGSAVTDPYDGVFWHGQCHMDDGVRSGPYLHMDAVGGWHDSGDYNKFPHGFEASGVNGLLWLYDNNRSYFDSLDVDANGIPDIVDEALYGARFLAKMVDDSSGHILQETRINRTGATFVRPESDTNNTICNCNSLSSCDACDDRWVDNGTEDTPQEMACSAALIRMHIICASKGLPTENFASKALSIWNHRVALAISQGGHNNLGNAPDQVTTGLDLYSVYGIADGYNRALQKIDEMATNANNNPAFYDPINYAEGPGSELGIMAWFARVYPSTYPANNARNAVVALMNHNINYLVAGNPIGLCRRDDAGSLQYFPTNSDNNGFFLGINRFYLFMSWGAIEAYRLVGDATYLRFAMDQYNWVMGANYNRVCMMDQAGDFNSPRYHTRYYKIPGHECGKQPGVVPNGYVKTYSTGLPQFDLGTDCTQLARYQTNEGWLINNASYAYALSNLSVLSNTNQAPYTGTAVNIPGTIQAENYDYGGEGAAYHDLSTRNLGGQYRPTDAVDIETTTDTGGGYDVGYIDTGEWLEYTVNVASAGTYNINMRVASCCYTGAYHIEMNGTNVTGTRTLPNTGGWQTWATSTASSISLNAGTQVLRVYVEAGGWNLNYIDIQSAGGGSPTFTNSSFEGGFTAAGGGYNGSVGSGWIPYTYSGVPSDLTFADETGTGNFDTGAHAQKITAGAAKEGGVYNQFNTVSGQTYTVTVRVKSGSPAAWCFFGINTSGGTDAHESSGTFYPANNSRSTSWTTFTWTGQATGSKITLFLDTYDGVGYWDTAMVGFTNSGFEAGFGAAGGGYNGFKGNGWTPYVYTGVPGDLTFADETGAGNFDTGAHSQKIQAGTGKEGGVYNQINTVSGQYYRITVRVKSGSPAAWCFFGINTNGGTDPHESSGTFYPADNSRSAAWTTFTWTGQATGSKITLFLDTYDGVAYWDTVTP